MMMIYMGPKQQWEAELEKVSKGGLCWLAASLLDAQMAFGWQSIEQIRKRIATKKAARAKKRERKA